MRTLPGDYARSSHELFIDEHPDAIEVQVGNMRIAFPANTPQATIDKKVKQVQDAPRKWLREADRHFKMDAPLKPLKRPSVDMLRCTGLAEDDPEFVRIPEQIRREAMVELARKRCTAWLKDPKGDLAASKYQRDDMDRIMASTTDEQLERLIESNIKPGARLEGKFAATLCYCWDELARRRDEVAA